MVVWLLYGPGWEGPAFEGCGSRVDGYPRVAGSAEARKVLDVEDASASGAAEKFVDVDGGGGVAALADGSLLEEGAD